MNEMKRETLEGSQIEIDQTTGGIAVSGRKRPAAEARLLRLVAMLIVPALLLLAGVYYWFAGADIVSTDNAAVKQDIVSVSAQIAGPVSEVLVENGDQVKRGDLLFRVDPAPFRVALAAGRGPACRRPARDPPAADASGRHGRRHRRVAGRPGDQAPRDVAPVRLAQAGLHHAVRL